VVAKVRDALEGTGRLTTIDGVRITWDDGAWALVRASNTGPILVLRFEGPSEKRLLEVQNLIENAVQKARAELGSRVAG
jgi:phosphomannomutase/phosphoglucomutase